jgi:hypothetical protein
VLSESSGGDGGGASGGTSADDSDIVNYFHAIAPIR